MNLSTSSIGPTNALFYGSTTTSNTRNVNANERGKPYKRTVRKNTMFWPKAPPGYRHLARRRSNIPSGLHRFMNEFAVHNESPAPRDAGLSLFSVAMLTNFLHIQK